MPAPETARQTYAVAATAYATAANTMAAYCEQPTADASTCSGAREAAVVAQRVIDETSETLAAGTVSDGQLERAAAVLDSVAAHLRAQEASR